jgi:hypothetical protein
LFRARRFDGAVYLCGYAVELALKARLCRSLRWNAFPETPHEFRGLQSVKTHDLEILLRLSGVEDRIKTSYMAEWSTVLDWDPEKRYQAVGVSTRQQASDMITATARLLGTL